MPKTIEDAIQDARAIVDLDMQINRLKKGTKALDAMQPDILIKMPDGWASQIAEALQMTQDEIRVRLRLYIQDMMKNRTEALQARLNEYLK